MRRLDIRCNFNVPVRVIYTNEEMSHYDTYTKNLGLYGAFLYLKNSLPKGFWTKLILKLQNENIETKGIVLRSEDEGVAIRFKSPDPKVKQTIFDTIKEHLPQNNCPFCGMSQITTHDICSYCGFPLDFYSPLFLEEFEKRILKRKLETLYSYIDKFVKKCDFIENYKDPTIPNEMIMLDLENNIYTIANLCREIEELGICDSDFLSKFKKDVFEKTDSVFSKSYFINYARNWPKGYPGDYKLLELIYRNMPLSSGIGEILDKIFLRAKLAEAVRGRLNTMVKLLQKELSERSGLKILNIACGSCRELIDLTKEIKESKASITCVDLDDEALDFAARRASLLNIDNQVSFRKYNAIRMIKPERILKEFGTYDLVYSIGLFDYLSDEIVTGLFRSLYEILNKQGKLIIAFKDANAYDPSVYHWIVNWNAFLQRTPYDVLMLLDKAGISKSEVTLIREPSGVITFYMIEKN
jgi:SAM-dependent methyltransferase